MTREHNYNLTVKWTGNKESGTDTYTTYDRSHSVFIENKPELLFLSDAAFRWIKQNTHQRIF